MTAHMLVDLLLWFRGVQIFWPISGQINIWSGPPDWWIRSELSAEFACFAVFFAVLILLARRRQTNGDYLRRLWRWAIVEVALFAAFLILSLIPGVTMKDFQTCWWLAYTPSLVLMFYVIIRMRGTIDSTTMQGADRGDIQRAS